MDSAVVLNPTRLIIAAIIGVHSDWCGYDWHDSRYAVFGHCHSGR